MYMLHFGLRILLIVVREIDKAVGNILEEHYYLNKFGGKLNMVVFIIWKIVKL